MISLKQKQYRRMLIKFLVIGSIFGVILALTVSQKKSVSALVGGSSAGMIISFYIEFFHDGTTNVGTKCTLKLCNRQVP